MTTRAPAVLKICNPSWQIPWSGQFGHNGQAGQKYLLSWNVCFTWFTSLFNRAGHNIDSAIKKLFMEAGSLWTKWALCKHKKNPQNRWSALSSPHVIWGNGTGADVKSISQIRPTIPWGPPKRLCSIIKYINNQRKWKQWNYRIHLWR